MWTSENRAQYERSEQRDPSDLRDDEGVRLVELIPAAKTGGRPCTTDMREFLNAVLYLLRTGCSRRQLPKDFPPWKSVYRILRDFQERGTWEQVHDALHKAVREAEGKEAAPTAVIVDSQSVKCGGQKGGIAATMPARKSGAASGTSSSTPSARSPPSSSMGRYPGSRGERGWSCRFSAPASLSFKRCLPMAAIPATSLPLMSFRCIAVGWKSSNAQIQPRVSLSCPNAGSSSAPSDG